MPRVLLVSASDLDHELGRTILWRSSIERIFAQSPDAGLASMRSVRPKLVVFDGAERDGVLAAIQSLRADPDLRRCSVAVLSRSPTLADEDQFREAGANVVLSGEVDPGFWDERLDSLLTVPRRREARIPVRFDVFSRMAPDEAPSLGVALNISIRGLLIETDDPLDMGTRLHLAFVLPGGHSEARTVGQVAREAQVPGARPRQGVEFLILRGDARDRIQAFIESEIRA